jgi:hypothetical protein
MAKNYRAHMDANRGVPPDHPGNSVKPKGVPSAASAHKAFVSRGTETNLGATLQPAPKAHHGGHPVHTAKGTIRKAK